MRKILEQSGFTFTNEQLDLPSYANTLKIDVGLSVNAPQSAVWLNQDPQLFVIGFEPILANRESIHRGDAPWPINLDPKLINNRIMIIPCALGASEEIVSMDMYVTKEDPGCSSLLRPKTFEVDYVERVSHSTLSQLFQVLPWDRFPIIDHLKIDVQGGDFDVLKGADNRICNVFAITLEVDTLEYEGTSNSLTEIKLYLDKLGFELVKTTWIERFMHRLKGYKIDVQVDDPTFINKTLKSMAKDRKFFIYQRG